MPYDIGDETEIDSNPIELEGRAQSIKTPELIARDVFPTEAWEFEDPDTNTKPKMILLDPWDLNIEHDVIVDGTITGNGAVLPGMEMFWPTETPPTGWLEEDSKTLGNAGSGADYAGDQYKNLYDVIQAKYGGTYDWANGDVVNLPDPRGRTIRVWDHGAGVDPDAATRADRGDTTTGDHVGTKQADAFQGHWHKLGDLAGVETYTRSVTPGAGIAQVGSTAASPYRTVQRAIVPITDGVNGAPRTTSESRGINVNRMMIIKY